jgi:chromosome segregation protein
VLARAREIERLGLERHQLEDRERELEGSIGRLREAQRSAEASRAQHQQALYQAHRKLAETAAALKTARSAAEVAAARMITLERESAELEGRIQSENEAIRQARAQLAAALDELEVLQANTAPLDQARNAARLAVDQLRAGQRQQREQAHQLELEIQALRTRRDALVAALQRARSELTEVDQGVARVAAEAIEADAPLAGLQAELDRHLQRRIAVEAELARARSRLDSAQQALRQLEQERQRNDQLLQQMRELLGAEQLKSQALSLRKEDIAAALAATGHDPAQLMADLPAEARAQDWAQRVSEIEQRVRRLEPVNLAAISELAQLDERKTYLDSQHADLSEALETLEGAIGRIDRETRTRFKDTFDKVSSGVKELFPRLFGGGHAYLELTGEDLLTTGVTIMARPPGKRVSNIGLLSGGEKALTAVSLVFAIFRLNPAPFCLLDEVDAPLDEANVGRFSEMVAEMSKSVQFVIVTHNKVTMESVSQLAGVTMREPGVSRLVSVDLAEATRLVG